MPQSFLPLALTSLRAATKTGRRIVAALLIGFVGNLVQAAEEHGHNHDHGAESADEPQVAFRPEGPRLGERAITLPLLMADRHLAVAVTLFDAFGKKMRVTLELSLDSPDCIILHHDQAVWLQVSIPTDGSEGAPLGFAFGDGELMVINAGDIRIESDRETMERQMLLTVRHASALQEQKLKGRIGLGFLRRYEVELDVEARQLRLAPLQSGGVSTVGDALIKFDAASGLLAVPLQNASQHVVIGSSNPESRISPDYARQVGRPNGDVASLVLNSAPALDLAAMVAFRPKQLGVATGDSSYQPVAVTGVDFLDGHRLAIDWESSSIAVTAKKPVTPSLANRAFFAAEVAGTAEALSAFLTEHSQSYFAREAAAVLMNLRLSEWGTSDEEVMAAFRWLLETMSPERRVDVARPIVQQLAKSIAQSHLAFEAGKLALEHSRAAISIQEVYRLHRILGAAYLESGDLDAAWRHLISATFTKIPNDPEHGFFGAYHLGEVYEQQGRLARAYSRYRAALATERVPSSLRGQAETALARVRAKIPAEELALLDEQ